MKGSISVEKRTHPLWSEWQKIKSIHPKLSNSIIGEFQYLYRSPKGEISLIELLDYFHMGVNLWEIYQIDGQRLFEDVERFRSKEEAEKRIDELL